MHSSQTEQVNYASWFQTIQKLVLWTEKERVRWDRNEENDQKSTSCNIVIKKQEGAR